MNKYQLGDSIKVLGIECQVRYVNNGFLYAAPIRDEESGDMSKVRKFIKNCVCAKIDAKTLKFTLI